LARRLRHNNAGGRPSSPRAVAAALAQHGHTTPRSSWCACQRARAYLLFASAARVSIVSPQFCRASTLACEGRVRRKG
jgi:hypothetical protein